MGKKKSEIQTAKLRTQRYFHVMKENAKVNKLMRPSRKYKFCKRSSTLSSSQLNQNYGGVGGCQEREDTFS